ncbi:MAG: ABC transporter permease [Tenericutes bacterium]|nr:ABC transporter permease [Mycoplasmatota bacterium]
MKFKRTIVWTVVITLWFLFTMYQLKEGFNGAVVIPNPYLVIKSFINILKNGYASHTLLQHAGASFGRLFTAILIAVLTAIPLGLLCGYVKKIETVVSTIVEFIRPLPPLAYYTIIILATQIGNTSKVILLFIAAFAPMYIACVQAVKQVRKDYILSSQTLGANGIQIFRNVVLPSALPNIFTGIRTAIGVAYTTLVSAEMVAAKSGLGYMILYAYNVFQTEVVFVGIILIGISAVLLDDLLKFTEKKLVFWKGQA